MKKYKKLCPELVDALGEVKEERKAKQKEESKLVEITKEFFGMKDAPGKKTVITLPDGEKKIQKVYKGKDYEAVYSEFQALDVSWRDEYAALWKKVHGKAGWKKHLKNLPCREQSQLDVNPR